MTDTVFAILKQLELELCNPAVRKAPFRLAELLADDFEEVGKSGRKFSKQQIIEHLQQETEMDFTAQDFTFIALADDCVLVKYVTEIEEQLTYRSSIWVKRVNRWQLQYHQGTSIIR